MFCVVLLSVSAGILNSKKQQLQEELAKEEAVRTLIEKTKPSKPVGSSLSFLSCNVIYIYIIIIIITLSLLCYFIEALPEM
eukprot:COSAG06_NODE_5791_length_3272_cov_22.469587_4_plen_81_part_00